MRKKPIDELTRRVMRANKSSGNQSTEIKAKRFLKTLKLNGWRRNSRLPGRPDFIFSRRRVALFIDGCFWHFCTRCKRLPRRNSSYWTEKFTTNQSRDKRVTSELRKKGWRVIRIWEHELKADGKKAVLKMKRI